MSAADVFKAIADGLPQNQQALKTINGVFIFKIGDKQWTVDVKNAPGSVSEGANGKADCTITIAEKDFVDLMTGKANGQNLFMSGRLKIQGNMGLAMKLQNLKAQAPAASAAPAAPAAAAAPSGLKSAAVFDQLKQKLAQNPDLVKTVGAIYQFNITQNGKTTSYFCDIKNGKGSIEQGSGKAECTITAADDDFFNLMTGKANAQSLFMGGKLKIQGNMGLAMKLSKLQDAQSKL